MKTPPAQVAEGQGDRAPASIGASWSGMQQQYNWHMGTTMMHISGSTDDLFYHRPLVPLACLQQHKEWMEALCVKETSAADLDGV